MSKGLEGLEALEYLGFCQIVNGIDCEGNIILDYLFRVNEEKFNIIEKELNVLEIIKNKCVNVNTLINSIIGAINPLEFYNEKVSENLKLTQQEYELLKEVLGNE